MGQRSVYVEHIIALSRFTEKWKYDSPEGTKKELKTLLFKELKTKMKDKMKMYISCILQTVTKVTSSLGAITTTARLA